MVQHPDYQEQDAKPHESSLAAQVVTNNVEENI